MVCGWSKKIEKKDDVHSRLYAVVIHVLSKEIQVTGI